MNSLTFSIGPFAIVVSLFATMVYLVSFLFRSIGAWLVRSPQPRDRVVVILMLAAVSGLVVGGLLQSSWDALHACIRHGHSLSTCLLGQHMAP